jgi:DNA-binding Xre family transcriptional regulator
MLSLINLYLKLQICKFHGKILSVRGITMNLSRTPNERIIELRIRKGFSQKELSKMIGLAPSQLSRIENGETKRISSDILIKLAKGLNVSTDYILGLTSNS